MKTTELDYKLNKECKKNLDDSIGIVDAPFLLSPGHCLTDLPTARGLSLASGICTASLECQRMHSSLWGQPSVGGNCKETLPIPHSLGGTAPSRVHCSLPDVSSRTEPGSPKGLMYPICMPVLHRCSWVHLPNKQIYFSLLHGVC